MPNSAEPVLFASLSTAAPSGSVAEATCAGKCRRVSVRGWLTAFSILAVAALAIGTLGLNSLPLDKHEALVVQTSTEMLERSDLVVPYFNGEPRLKKPPLSYWATIAVHQVRAEPDEPLQAVDARIPSLAAMFGILALVVALAWQAGGRIAGLAAGAVAVASPMLAYFSHDARPDTLYAFLTFAGAAALASALLSSDDHGGRRSAVGLAYLGWLLWGLATLTKGPHIPVMIAVGLFIFAVREFPDWRVAGRRLRPLSGLVLMALTALPWWWMLQHGTDPQALADSQLGGTLYQPGLAALRDSYRELLAVGLLFPWFFLIPVFYREARALLGSSAIARMCAYGYVVPLALLLFSPQHRWHYMLPAAPFLAVFCGLLADRLMQRRGFRTAFAVVFITFALFLAANAAFQWVWDDARFARQQYLAPLAAPDLQGVSLAATGSIESAFQVLVATARRPVRLLESHSEMLRWEASLAQDCGILLTTDDDLEQIRPLSLTIPLAGWVEHGRRITLRVAGNGQDCDKVIDAYRKLTMTSPPGATG